MTPGDSADLAVRAGAQGVSSGGSAARQGARNASHPPDGPADVSQMRVGPSGGVQGGAPGSPVLTNAAHARVMRADSPWSAMPGGPPDEEVEALVAEIARVAPGLSARGPARRSPILEGVRITRTESPVTPCRPISPR